MMDDHGGSDLSVKELTDELTSRPKEITEWLWCVEYVAKFAKDISCILDFINMGYRSFNNYGRRISEILSLRVMEYMFDPTINVGITSTSEARVDFDLSLSNADVLRTILEEIQVPVSELRAGMPELSKFNVLPFIAHKNAHLQQCALEKLFAMRLMENQTNATTPPGEAGASVFRDDRSLHLDTFEEEQMDEQQVHNGLDQNINDEDELAKKTNDKDEDEDELAKKTNDKDEDEDELAKKTNDKDEVIVIDDDTAGEPLRDCNITGKTFPSSRRRWSEDARVKCTKDGTWLISDSDDEDDESLMNKNRNRCRNLLPRRRTEEGCWKCGKEGRMLICSNSECASKVYKECLNCAVNVDEVGNFHCPVCWYDQVVEEYMDSKTLMSSAKRKLVNLLPLLSARSKRLG